MNLINQGAEAKIYTSSFKEYFGLDIDRDLIVKERVSKSYRIPELDKRIVLSRTLHEAKLLHEAKNACVETPVIYFIDKSKHAIVMEYVRGTRAKEELIRSPLDGKDIVSSIGRSVAAMHSNNIIHGDLTTSNIIIRCGKMVFIDFGLGEFSSEIEKQAVDAHLFKQALKSTHFGMWEIYWKEFKASYSTAYRRGGDVLGRISEIESRGRYIERGE